MVRIDSIPNTHAEYDAVLLHVFAHFSAGWRRTKLDDSTITPTQLTAHFQTSLLKILQRDPPSEFPTRMLQECRFIVQHICYTILAHCAEYHGGCVSRDELPSVIGNSLNHLSLDRIHSVNLSHGHPLERNCRNETVTRDGVTSTLFPVRTTDKNLAKKMSELKWGDILSEHFPFLSSIDNQHFIQYLDRTRLRILSLLQTHERLDESVRHQCITLLLAEAEALVTTIDYHKVATVAQAFDIGDLWNDDVSMIMKKIAQRMKTEPVSKMDGAFLMEQLMIRLAANNDARQLVEVAKELALLLLRLGVPANRSLLTLLGMLIAAFEEQHDIRVMRDQFEMKC